jgi:hypothetical protein
MKTLSQEERAPSVPAEWSPSMHELYLVFKHDNALPWDLHTVARESGPGAFEDILADSIGFAENAAERERERERASIEPYESSFDAALANGIKPSTFLSRIKNGWSMERAINTPTRKYTQRRRGRAIAAAAPAYDVILVAAGKKLIAKAPQAIATGVSWDKAEAITARLERLGATVKVRQADHGK